MVYFVKSEQFLMNCAEVGLCKIYTFIVLQGLAFWWHFLFFPTLFRKTRQTQSIFFETFVCIMATCKSQIIYGLRDRQKFSRAKKPLQLQTLKERSKYR